MRDDVERDFPDVPFVDLGVDPTGGVLNPEFQARVAAHQSFLGGTMDILRGVNAK